VFQSEQVQMIVVGFIGVAVFGTLASAVILWRHAHGRAVKPA
jgi:hypothetical protein